MSNKKKLSPLANSFHDLEVKILERIIKSLETENKMLKEQYSLQKELISCLDKKIYNMKSRYQN